MIVQPTQLASEVQDLCTGYLSLLMLGWFLLHRLHRGILQSPRLENAEVDEHETFDGD